MLILNSLIHIWISIIPRILIELTESVLLKINHLILISINQLLLNLKLTRFFRKWLIRLLLLSISNDLNKYKLKESLISQEVWLIMIKVLICRIISNSHILVGELYRLMEIIEKLLFLEVVIVAIKQHAN